MPQQLFKNIFRREEHDLDNDVFFKGITEQYPYFGLAQFYTLKNIRYGRKDFNEIAARTALFFNDPFLLNARLQAEETIPAPVKHEEPVFAEPTVDIYTEEPKEEEIKPETVIPETTDDHKEIKNERPEIFFEPLHATDYFASQGIKLSDEPISTDKLSNQLKSFTAWLKTMKKVHPDRMPAENPVIEAAVQNLAEKSNLKEDIITEAMAEAFVQQGKSSAARDIYSKLSLINPAKSAYFAAKIESLKQ